MASFSPRTSPADLIVGYSRFCVNYGIGILSHVTFECCAHLPTYPFITPFLLRILFLDQRDSVPTLLKCPQLTCTRLTISNLQNDAHHPRKANPVNLTHQTYAHLLYFPYSFEMDLKHLRSRSHFLDRPWRFIVLSAPRFRYFRGSALFSICFTLILSFYHRLKTCVLALEVHKRTDLLDFHLLFTCCFFSITPFALSIFLVRSWGARAPLHFSLFGLHT